MFPWKTYRMPPGTLTPAPLAAITEKPDSLDRHASYAVTAWLADQENAA